ncbi:hypothetical protein MM221_09980 [Salipaludibacillus sp. LMS25]|jgi:similar to spore coat protein|uniref:hypothetical protein n=1 Tax=Salipaludibacillus sp. LMS25 TaxID=2924031 RepID=UPI0020D167F1|nr:hypothetical protein [Salipaludibacillus sp. LMS25]UTR16810.1 hypothetical protein MM221_09980 [Salipaludibacillus sp. LMS25]
MPQNIGVHESLELHELMTFKSLCLTKATVMQGLVSDNELKTIMQEDVTASKRHLADLEKYFREGS